MSRVKILIDNGHGIETAGKRSPDGRLREYAWAREVAKDIVDELNSYGFDAELVTPETKDVSLKERVARVNKYCSKYGKKNVLFISVHVNAAGNGKNWMNARGWSAYTTPSRTRSDDLADDLYWAARQVFGKDKTIRADYSDGDPDWESNFYVLKNTLCCAVLTENFFQDNKQDVEYLLSKQGKEECVTVHVSGIISYLQRQ